MAGRVTASIVTIGNELLSGDTVNTNAAWLAHELEELGVTVTMMASLPDEIDRIAEFVRAESGRADIVIVTGGLGGTPDDVTREALAAAFEAPQDEVVELAERLRSRFPSDPEYAARWANLPAGARPLENPLGGAPGFVVANVFVLPGLPSEMQAMFATIAHEFRTEQPITSWRRVYETTEAKIVGVLEAMGDRYPGVLVGSYPKFHVEGATVEVVVKSSDPAALEAAVAWIEQALAEATGETEPPSGPQPPV
jgi:molybdenum cofactor synthesis domain-containing protein